MAGGSDVAESTLTCVKCGKPARLQYVNQIHLGLSLYIYFPVINFSFCLSYGGHVGKENCVSPVL